MLGRLARAFSSDATGVSNLVLKRSHVEAISKDGFVVVPNLLPNYFRTNLNYFVKIMEDWPELAGRYMKYYASDPATGKRKLLRIENFIAFQSELRNAVDNLFLDVANDALNNLPVPLREFLDIVHPGSEASKPRQIHADSSFLNISKHLVMVTSVQTTSQENGGLQFAQGSHNELYPHVDSVLSQAYVDKFPWVSVTTQPGDVVLFNSFTPFKSSANSLPLATESLYFLYNSVNDAYSHELFYNQYRTTNPPEVERGQGDFSMKFDIFSKSLYN
jgi:hypothetical protein